jgi:CDP-paratose 2-epimerase
MAAGAMKSKKVLVTGCNGLVGSAVVDRLITAGGEVVGIDNDMRGAFFGRDGSTASVGLLLEAKHGSKLVLRNLDVRDAYEIDRMFAAEQFAAVVHCASQPSHDLSASNPMLDFDVNAVGTMELLVGALKHAPTAPFVFMSTNKVYGCELGDVIELETRLDLVAEPEGISEEWPIDGSMRSPYGASKLAADVMVQEFGRYYGMPTVCLRAGCLTGAGHAAVKLHGFLSYVVKCNLRGDCYVVKGYGGKQVRDNLHAVDLAELIAMIIDAPPEPGSVFNVGGGRDNSCSIREAFTAVESLTDLPMNWTLDPEPRRGDQCCYYTDLRRVREAYPDWRIKHDLSAIYQDLVADWMARG